MHAPASVEASHEKPNDFITVATIKNLISTSSKTHPSTSPKFDIINACSKVCGPVGREGRWGWNASQQSPCNSSITENETNQTKMGKKQDSTPVGFVHVQQQHACNSPSSHCKLTKINDRISPIHGPRCSTAEYVCLLRLCPWPPSTNTLRVEPSLNTSSPG